MEFFISWEGYYLLVYFYEGCFVYEGMGVLIVYWILCLRLISFFIVMNDYGFELLLDIEILIEEVFNVGLFSIVNLWEDI